MFAFRGVPIRELNGLPYSVHQCSDAAWQIVIQNCPRYPAGYTFEPKYESYEEALSALNHFGTTTHEQWASGDDTGALELIFFEE